jgi:hypothetical protein
MVSDKWHMNEQWRNNCNCAYGSPRDFNPLPTRGKPETESEPIKILATCACSSEYRNHAPTPSHSMEGVMNSSN